MSFQCKQDSTLEKSRRAKRKQLTKMQGHTRPKNPCQASHSKHSRQNTFNLCVQACSRARDLGNNSIFMSRWRRKWQFYWSQQSHDSMLPECPCTQPQGKCYSLSIQTKTNSAFYFKLFDPAGLERILQSPWRARVTGVQICST